MFTEIMSMNKSYIIMYTKLSEEAARNYEQQSNQMTKCEKQ